MQEFWCVACDHPFKVVGLAGCKIATTTAASFYHTVGVTIENLNSRLHG